MSLFNLLLATGRAVRLSLLGEVVSEASAFPTPSEAKIIFRRDGTIDKETNAGGVVQIDTDTDWIASGLRSATVGDGYEVRYVTSPTDAFTTDDLGGLNNWTAISSDLTVGYGPASNTTLSSGNVTFEIRIGSSGNAVTSGVYSLDIDAAGP